MSNSLLPPPKALRSAGGGATLIATHIDLGLEAEILDVTPYKADPDHPGRARSAFDEAFG